jgi:hypothetical protein
MAHNIDPNVCENEHATGSFQRREILLGPDRHVHAVSSFSPTIRTKLSGRPSTLALLTTAVTYMDGFKSHAF